MQPIITLPILNPMIPCPSLIEIKPSFLTFTKAIINYHFLGAPWFDLRRRAIESS